MRRAGNKKIGLGKRVRDCIVQVRLETGLSGRIGDRRSRNACRSPTHIDFGGRYISGQFIDASSRIRQGNHLSWYVLRIGGRLSLLRKPRLARRLINKLFRIRILLKDDRRVIADLRGTERLITVILFKERIIAGSKILARTTPAFACTFFIAHFFIATAVGQRTEEGGKSSRSIGNTRTSCQQDRVNAQKNEDSASPPA